MNGKRVRGARVRKFARKSASEVDLSRRVAERLKSSEKSSEETTSEIEGSKSLAHEEMKKRKTEKSTRACL